MIWYGPQWFDAVRIRSRLHHGRDPHITPHALHTLEPRPNARRIRPGVRPGLRESQDGLVPSVSSRGSADAGAHRSGTGHESRRKAHARSRAHGDATAGRRGGGRMARRHPDDDPVCRSGLQHRRAGEHAAADARPGRRDHGYRARRHRRHRVQEILSVEAGPPPPGKAREARAVGAGAHAVPTLSDPGLFSRRTDRNTYRRMPPFR
jgi:hypothetical protein